MIRWPILILAAAFLMAGAAQATQAQAPSNVDELLTAGDRAWEQGRIQEAEEAFQGAVEAAPGSPDPLLRLAGLQLSLQRYREGLRSYQAILSLQPDSQTLGRAYLGMGLAYLHLGNRELAKQALLEASDHVSEQTRPDVERVLRHLESQGSAGEVPASSHP